MFTPVLSARRSLQDKIKGSEGPARHNGEAGTKPATGKADKTCEGKIKVYSHCERLKVPIPTTLQGSFRVSIGQFCK